MPRLRRYLKCKGPVLSEGAKGKHDCWQPMLKRGQLPQSPQLWRTLTSANDSKGVESNAVTSHCFLSPAHLLVCHSTVVG